MRRILLLLTLAAAAAPLAPAQDDSSVSWFAQFLWSDDALGLLIIWFLVALSALSVGFTIKLAITYRRPLLLPEQTREQVAALIDDKKYREAISFVESDSSYLGRITGAALNEAANGYAAMERAVEEAGDAETARMLRPLEYLNVLGNIAPMIGLFGTVYGMIVAFQTLVSEGGQADPAKLAAGISTALVTTLWGLVVAIPALAAYATIRNRVDALTSEGMLMAEQIIGPFKPAGRGDGAKSAGGGTARRRRATPKPE